MLINLNKYIYSGICKAIKKFIFSNLILFLKLLTKLFLHPSTVKSLIYYYILLFSYPRISYKCNCIEYGLPDSLVGKESAYNAGNPSSISGLERSPGGGHGNPLQYSGLENSMDCIVHGFAKSWTRLSNFHTHTHIHIECTLLCLTYYFQYRKFGDCFNINCLFLKFVIRIAFYKCIMMFKNLFFVRHFGFSEVLSY